MAGEIVLPCRQHIWQLLQGRKGSLLLHCPPPRKALGVVAALFGEPKMLGFKSWFDFWLPASV